MAKQAEIDKVRSEKKDLKAENKRLEKLYRKGKRDLKAVQNEPNVAQLAITGATVTGGAGAGIAAHRGLRKMTRTWLKPKDPKDEAAKAALEAYKKGTATEDQKVLVAKNTKRTGLSYLVCEVVPAVGGLGVGAGTAMSDNGIVASVGGLGWGFAGGILLDCLLPGPPPPPPEAPKP